MTVKPPASSDDELIDFDHEAADHLSSLPCSSGAKCSNKRRRNGRLDATSFSEVEAKKERLSDGGGHEDSMDGTFKVVGQLHVPATSNPRNVVAPWVIGATGFSANVAADDEDSNSSHSMTIDLSSQLVSNLATNCIHRWFPVQEAVLPMLLGRPEELVLPPRDAVIYAPTGSGKTLCYVVPILDALLRQDVGRRAATANLFALVVVPVKDLARQVHKVFHQYGGKAVMDRVSLLNGDDDYEAERSALFGKHCGGESHGDACVVICTPGRLVEHLVDNVDPALDLSSLRYLVIDEADRMQATARMEWLKLVESRANASDVSHMTYANLTGAAKNCRLQKILLSATLSLDVDRLHTWNLRAPQLFKVDARSVKREVGGEFDDADAPADANEAQSHQLLILPSKLTRRVVVCEQRAKPLLLYLILARKLAALHDRVSNSVPDCLQLPEKEGGWRKVIVFTNKRLTSLRLNMLLNQLSGSRMKVAEMSRNLKGKRRSKCLKRFRARETQVLVSSDVISHGIDVDDVDCVVNYDLPANERIFVHRAGRTARANHSGFLLSLVSKEEKMRMKKMLSAHRLWNDSEVIDQRRVEDSLPPHLLHQYQQSLDGLRDQLVQKPSHSSR